MKIQFIPHREHSVLLLERPIDKLCAEKRSSCIGEIYTEHTQALRGKYIAFLFLKLAVLTTRV
jgi:hypothetical protein